MEEINVTFQVCEHIDPEMIVERIEHLLDAHAYAIHNVDQQHKVVSFIFPLAITAKEKKLIRKFEKLVKKANKKAPKQLHEVNHLPEGFVGQMLNDLLEKGVITPEMVEKLKGDETPIETPTDEDYAEFFGSEK